MKQLARICVERPLLAWAIVFALAIPPFCGFLGFRIAEPVPSEWVSPEVLDAYTQAKETFRFNAPIVVVMECEDFFTRDRILALTRTVTRLRETEGVRHVAWMGDIPEVSLRGTQKLLLPQDPEALTDEAIASSREALLSHPLVSENLITADGQTALFLVDIREERFIDNVRQVCRGQLEDAGIRSRITGGMALYDVHDRALRGDHHRIQLLAYSLVCFLTVYLFRKPAAIVIAGSGPVTGIVWTTGWLMLIGQSENELARIILPVMIIMIGFTDGVHLVVRIRQLRAQGLSAHDASFQAVQLVGPACLLTSVTTAIGFGSLTISNSEMIAGFGKVSAIGVVVTFLAVVLVTPLLANSWLGKRMHVDPGQDRLGSVMKRGVSLVDFSSRHARLVTLVGVLLTISCVLISTGLTPDDRISDRVPHQSEEWQTMRSCDEQLGGTRYTRLVISWSEQNTRNEVWNAVRQCQEVLAQESLIGKSISIRTMLSVFRGSNRQDQPILVSRLPEELTQQFYRPELRRTLVVARVRDLGIVKFEPVFTRVESAIREIQSAHPGFSINVISDVMVEGRVVRQLIEELMKSLLMAAVVIFAVLALAFRSLRIGMVSILPNIMPLAASGALRYFINDSLGIASACSFAICLGIAVDDTIHYLSHFRHERRNGCSPHEANRRTFVSVGSALMMTTVVMTAGLATVLTSQMPPHVNFAAMGCTTLAVALPADLIFLPALLALFPGRDTLPATDTKDTTTDASSEVGVPA